MKWLLVVCVTATLTVLRVSSVQMPKDEFINQIQERCYTRLTEYSQPIPSLIMRWNNDRSVNRPRTDTLKDGPISQSVESLIALIEKIEVRKPNINARNLALMLLRKYRIDDLSFTSSGFFEISENIRIQNMIENAVLGADDVNYAEINDILDDSENCTIHYLLSHNVDISPKSNDKSSIYRPKVASPQSGSTNNRNEFERFKPRYVGNAGDGVSKRPREYGIGTFRQHLEQGIALNKLLLGIVAGLSPETVYTVEQLISMIKGNVDLSPVKLNIKAPIDPLMAVTLAGTFAYGAYTNEQNYQNLFGAVGSWNSTLCATEYGLKVDKEILEIKDIPGIAATMAEVRGAIDGYALGEAMRELTKYPTPRGGELKLSQILQLYYSQIGFEPVTTQYGYCKRKDMRIDSRTINDQAKAYRRLSFLLSQGMVNSDDNWVTSPIDKVGNEFEKVMMEAKNIPNEDDQWCNDQSRLSTQNVNEAMCETPSDVFIMLDRDNEMEKQFELIDALTRELDTHRFGGSVTILVNAENSTNRETLHRITWGATNKGCATCRLAYADQSDFISAVGFDKLPLVINDTLRDFKEMKKQESAVPSRPFIILNFGSYAVGKVNIQRFNNGRNVLKEKHRDVPLIVVSDKKDYDYITDNSEEDFVSTENQDTTQVIEKLTKRICETPATFQHSECTTPSRDAKYKGYITEGRVQHWAMYPEYFLKSYDITFRFKAALGKLQVCHSRSPKPGFNDARTNCYKNDQNDEIVFTRQNPCHKFTKQTCAPFYFTIHATSDTTNVPLCKEQRCNNLKQIAFEFTHTGISCNKAFGVVLSPLMSILTVFAVSFVYLRKP